MKLAHPAPDFFSALSKLLHEHSVFIALEAVWKLLSAAQPPWTAAMICSFEGMGRCWKKLSHNTQAPFAAQGQDATLSIESGK